VERELARSPDDVSGALWGVDRRSAHASAFEETIRGIIGAGSLSCQQIAAHSAVFSKGKEGWQRGARLASGGSHAALGTGCRADNQAVAHRGSAAVGASPEDELRLIADSSDLRKAYAEAMPYLMQVRNLDGDLVPGYRTQSAVRRDAWATPLTLPSALKHQAPDFGSPSKEVQEALETVSQALAPLKKQKTVTWILNNGFEDVAVWRTIWEWQEHVVSCIYHTEWTVAFQDQQGDIEQARAQLGLLPRVETTDGGPNGASKLARRSNRCWWNWPPVRSA